MIETCYLIIDSELYDILTVHPQFGIKTVHGVAISNHLVIPSWFQTESILLKTGYPITVLGYDVSKCHFGQCEKSNHSSFRDVSPIKTFEDRCTRNLTFLNMDARLISSGMTALIQHTHKHTSLSKCKCLVIPNDKNTHFDKLNAFGLR